MKLIWPLFITFFLSSTLVLAETVDFNYETFPSGKNCFRPQYLGTPYSIDFNRNTVLVCMDKTTYTETKGKLYICNYKNDNVPAMSIIYSATKLTTVGAGYTVSTIYKQESKLDQIPPKKCLAIDINIPSEQGTYILVIDGKTWPKITTKITFSTGVIDTEEKKEEVKKTEEQLKLALNPKFEQVEITKDECKKIMPSFKNSFPELKGVNVDDFCNSYTLSKHALIFSSTTNNFIVVPIKYISDIKLTSAAEVAIDATATKFDQEKAKKFVQNSKLDADKWKGMIKLFCKSPSNSWDRQGIYCIRDVGTSFVSDPEKSTYYVYVTIPKNTWVGYAESIGLEEVQVEIGIWKPGCVGVKLEESKTTLATDGTPCSEAGKIEEYKYLFNPKVAENIPVGKTVTAKPETFTIPKNIVGKLFGSKEKFESALKTVRTDCKYVKEEGNNYQYSCTGTTTTGVTCADSIKKSIKDRDSACANKGEVSGTDNQYLCSNVCSGEIEGDTHTLHDIPCRDITESTSLEGYKCTSGKWTKTTEQPSSTSTCTNGEFRCDPSENKKIQLCKDGKWGFYDSCTTECDSTNTKGTAYACTKTGTCDQTAADKKDGCYSPTSEKKCETCVQGDEQPYCSGCSGYHQRRNYGCTTEGTEAVSTVDHSTICEKSATTTSGSTTTCDYGTTSGVQRTCSGVTILPGYYWCKDGKAYMVKPTNCV